MAKANKPSKPKPVISSTKPTVKPPPNVNTNTSMEFKGSEQLRNKKKSQ